MTTPHVPAVTLNNGVTMPQLGFGVWQVGDDEAVAAVSSAFEAGYRSIDTAAIYGNERGVGRAIAQSGLSRADLFITTKLWNTDQGYDSTLRAFEESLGLLGLDYVDLYLIHWPTPARDKYVETWKAFEKLLADGRTRAIGVSNFQIPHLERLMAETSIAPAVNQVELHPQLQQAELRAFHQQHGIHTEAWSPLAQGELLQHPDLVALAARYGRSTAQIILRWHLQIGNVVIPKSVTPSRIRENFDVFGFTLDEAAMAAIAALNRDERVGPLPDTFDP